MDAILRVREEMDIAPGKEVRIVIWLLPSPLEGSRHNYKYRCAFIVDDVCVLRFDNEAGKGDHLHRGSKEYAYDFVSEDDLLVDFWKEVDLWLEKRAR
jgi:hypothetical protein